MRTLRLILGDQLNHHHSWFQKKDDEVLYCLLEMRQETDYVVHHIQKIVGFFLAMRNFAEELKSLGHQVIYYKINSSSNLQSLTENLNQLVIQYNIEKFEYLLPDEYRLDQQLKAIEKSLNLETEVFDTEHFLTQREELKSFFHGKKQYLMESFYRYMRKKHHILMKGSKPEGGQWNYDKFNRKKWKEDTLIPPHKSFPKDVSLLIKEIHQSGVKTIGNINSKSFDFPISRKEALEQLNYFCKHLLIHFGDYQDAMHTDQVNLYHSRISFALNLKLISPKEVVEMVIREFKKRENEIHLSQVEGFVRQIIGWREYMRGMYWAFMPTYKELNELKNYNSLPKFFWTGNTKMNCLKNAICNSLDYAYAHHIQRLMITGNFALLIQVNPDEVDRWYLGVYADAIEWVQLTNTRGMSQYADGGKIATKPYVSSGSYIDKMSNYCQSCYYSKKEKIGNKSCPFNSLYWNFLDEKREQLSSNRRMGMMYNLLNKMSSEQLSKIKERAYHIIEHADEY